MVTSFSPAFVLKVIDMSKDASRHGKDIVCYQIIWNRLISIAEQQAHALVRCAFGAPTREAGDLSAGIYDAKGNMLSQAVTGTPGHVNSMAKSVSHVLDVFNPSQIEDGDAFIFNDPWKGTGHLNDIVLVTPVFAQQQLVAFFACTLHVVDIGGSSVFGRATQVYEEGLFLPILKIRRAGKINDDVIAIIQHNVRDSGQTLGDIFAEISSNDLGTRLLIKLIEKYGVQAFKDAGDYILETSRNASLELIRALPPGDYVNTMTVDGFGTPFTLKAKITIHENGIDVAYLDVPNCVGIGINVPMSYTEAYTAYGIKLLVNPDVPNNAGSLSVVTVSAPDGSLLNAHHPAPVAGRGSIGQLLPDVVIGCFSSIAEISVPAESSSSLWNIVLSGGAGLVPDVAGKTYPLGTKFNLISLNAGGMGAQNNQDGMSATAFPSGIRNVSVEILESTAPIVFTKKDLAVNSGGAGRFRGGLGQIVEIESRENTAFATSPNYDRTLYPARGRNGGETGKKGRVSLASGTPLPSRGSSVVPPGERLVIEMAGGGGYGPAYERDSALIARDIHYGYITEAHADEHYPLWRTKNEQAG